RRSPGALALTLDLRRFQAPEPITARPASVWYRSTETWDGEVAPSPWSSSYQLWPRKPRPRCRFPTVTTVPPVGQVARSSTAMACSSRRGSLPRAHGERRHDQVLLQGLWT